MKRVFEINLKMRGELYDKNCKKVGNNDFS